MILDLDLCQRLKEAGLSQDQFPQMVWRWQPTFDFEEHLEYQHKPPGGAWCTVPEAIDLLDWFERAGFAAEYHSGFQPDDNGGMKPLPWKWCFMDNKVKDPHRVTANTFADLARKILCILEAP